MSCQSYSSILPQNQSHSFSANQMQGNDGEEDLYDAQHWSNIFRDFQFQKFVCETDSSLIWQGRHIFSPTSKALKITERFQQESSEKRHQQEENRFLSSYELPNMVKVEQIREEEDYRMMVMKFYPWTLTQLLKAFTTKLECRYTQQHFDFIIYAFRGVITAVQQLHNIGFIHRDLKPDNFLVDQNYNIYVTDFALVSKELEVDLSLAGTLEYMPVERLSKIKRKQCLKKSSDIWALGIILYELFAGQCPFQGDSSEEIIERIYEGRIAAKNIPSMGIDLIDKMLQINSQNRISIQEIRAHPFLQKQVQMGSVFRSIKSLI